jgi:uncharacterized protein YndB with AHSA1/START domain
MCQMTENPSSSLTITHHFNAPVKVVWQAWTDPAIVQRWWGSDPDGVVTSAELDVRRGSAFEITFQDPDGDEHTCYGEYLRVETMRELDFTWAWRSEPNNTSRVNVAFTPDETGTQMRFVHSELNGESAHDYSQGWRRTFAKLDRVLSS